MKYLTPSQAANAVPAIRYAVKQAGAPGWIMALLGMIGKYLPSIIMLIIQLAPLFATGRYVPPASPSDPANDPLLDPELSLAAKDTIAHAIKMQRRGYSEPFAD